MKDIEIDGKIDYFGRVLVKHTGTDWKHGYSDNWMKAYKDKKGYYIKHQGKKFYFTYTGKYESRKLK
jgi:hypothetical protein